MWCSGSLHPSLGNSWRRFNSVHPDQTKCIVGPARSKTRRCHRRDPSSNLGRCTRLFPAGGQLNGNAPRLERGRNSTGWVRVFQTRSSGFESRRPLATPRPDFTRPRSSVGRSDSPVRKRSRVRHPPRAFAPRIHARVAKRRRRRSAKPDRGNPTTSVRIRPRA